MTCCCGSEGSSLCVVVVVFRLDEETISVPLLVSVRSVADVVAVKAALGRPHHHLVVSVRYWTHSLLLVAAERARGKRRRINIMKRNAVPKKSAISSIVPAWQAWSSSPRKSARST